MKMPMTKKNHLVFFCLISLLSDCFKLMLLTGDALLLISFTRSAELARSGTVASEQNLFQTLVALVG